MNEKNHQTATVNEGYLAAAAQLNKVPGFDPLNFLNRTGSENQEKNLSLDLRYKKLWFRLAYPKGRMKLIARHITEQMAIFEAQIYLDRSDNEPVGNFTATCTYEQAADFVKAAQDTALDYALANAGFGIQFEVSEPQAKVTRAPAAMVLQSSVATADHTDADKEKAKRNAETDVIPPLLKIVPKPAPVVSSEATAEPKLAAVRNESAIPKIAVPVKPSEVTATIDNVARTAEHPTIHNEAVKRVESAAPLNEIARMAETIVAPKEPVSQNEAAAVISDTLPAMEEMEFDRLPVELMREVPNHDEESLPVGPSMGTAGNENQTAQVKTVPLSRFTQPTMEIDQPEPARANVVLESVSEEELPVTSEQSAGTAETPSVPNYTADMPVAEIMQRMTFEEAQNVKVDVGTCSGWTMAQVAERRPPSLKWYVFGYKDNNNILRAAAQIMLDSISGKKAG